MTKDIVEVALAHKDNHLDFFEMDRTAAQLLKEQLQDESVETFSINDQTFSKEEINGVNIGGDWGVQFF